MKVIIRNLTLDNDVSIHLPMEEDKLREILGEDEWMVIDYTFGEEHMDLFKVNRLLQEYGEETLEVLCQSYLLDEIDNHDFIFVNFNEATAKWNQGYGIDPTDWWKGYVLHDWGFASFPFEYTEAMEDYVRFEQLWYTAESEGWREIKHGDTYLVKRVEE